MSKTMNNCTNRSCSMAPVSNFKNEKADQYILLMLISFLLCALSIIIIIKSLIRI